MLGLTFSVHPSHVSEDLEEADGPCDHVLQIATRKAEAVAVDYASGIVLGADTVVVLDNDIIEKPVDTADARAMLRRLAGRTHEVYTGVILIDAESGKTETGVQVTRVQIRDLNDHDIHAYAATGEPLDKAGAYAAQGQAAVFIEAITGCFYNVVGLPLTLVWSMLERLLQQSPWNALGSTGGRSGDVDLVTRPSADTSPSSDSIES
jgi:septum formation protein